MIYKLHVESAFYELQHFGDKHACFELFW